MKPRFRSRRSARWPFWLLIGAWVCANSPAMAVCTVLTWVGQARHFSHQQRLVTDVAFILTGHQAPGLGIKAAVKDIALPQTPPAVAAGVELKKIDLAVEGGIKVRRPVAAEKNFVVDVVTRAGAGRGAPPHEPPRDVVMS